MNNLSEFLKVKKEDLKGKVIVFPTDTVYGIGTPWLDYDGIEKIYELKKRDGRKPLAVLVHSFDQIKDYIEVVNDRTSELIDKYWPGAVTFIFKKKDSFAYPLNTIAFRVPNSKIALEILKEFGPLATTSVNLSGEEPINNVEEILDKFSDIDYIITNKEEFSSVSSTIVDLTTKEIKILRQGEIKII